ncbi:MAG TPA: MBL fold metallo-hydrolase [Candidatus Limiplasma pullicola]|nr:MBL fold metallo-hydrolase [Candidatus Limiplasma pullicola]
MKLTFLGAAREVTGSRFLLEAAGKNIMVDYGMEQGTDLYENAPLPVPESRIDYVFLTHAHIDHSGYLPLLYKNGFRGAIFATDATADLCRIMLLDSAHIQESDAEWQTRKAQRQGRPPVEPLYTQEDALGAHGLIRPCHYGQRVEVCPGVSLRMVDVGHLLGSASIEVTVTEGTQTRVIVFSGDIGNLHQPLLRDPQYLTAADLVVMESTYAGRSHGPAPDTIGALARVLQETFDRGGNVVIPSFAVGRTQELLYFIRQIKQEGRVHGHDGFPVYVDSPLGIEATTIFNENTRECADEETLALLRAGINPLAFDGLRVARSAEESKRINNDPIPKVILSSSGMCDAGRVRHHLKHNLWRPECTVLFAGYQSVGTLGRSLVDGAKEVRLFGETVAVHARIETLPGISGHADDAGLMRWISAFEEKPRHVFVVHGEDEAAAAFASRLQSELGLEANAPYNGESWDLLSLTCLAGGNRERLRRPSREAAALDALPGRKAPAHAAAKPDASTAYGQLVLAGEKLAALIRRMQGRGARQQSRLARQINTLVKKFSRN